jgi:hypothetical protein
MITKAHLKVTSWFHPYERDKTIVRIGKKAVLSAPATLKFSGAGVYLIKHKVAGKWKIIYVGMSASDVKKTLYRHFQKWTDKRSKWNHTRELLDRVTYSDFFSNKEYLVKVIATPTSEEAGILEEMLIKKIMPRDNKAKLNIYTQGQYDRMEVKYEEAEVIEPELEEAPF